MFHIAECLHIIDDGGAHVEAEGGGEVGRLDARVGALALQALDQTGFFAANVGACASVHMNLQIKTAAENVFAEITLGARFGEGGVKNFGAFGKLTTNVNVGEIHVVSPTGDNHPLEQLMRILIDDLLVLECARLGFVCVANEIDRLGIRMTDEAPFESAGKARTAASA